MRAVSYVEYGSADAVLVLKELPTPEPGAGEVLVRLHSSGVNPSDVKARAGTRANAGPRPASETIPHSDGAGIIKAVGSGVDESRIGQRVWIWNGQWQRAQGTAAEYIALPAEQAVPLPDNTDFETGAVLGIPALTACHCVFSGGDIAGQTVLVSGGAGTVGFLAVQMAKAGGAQVLATASADALDRVKAAGADEAFDYSNPNLADRIMAASNGQGVDRIVEVEFGANAEVNAQVIKPHGRIVSYGSAKDMSPTVPFYTLMFKMVTIETVLVYILTQSERQAAVERVNRMLTDGQINIPIHEVFDLADCARAHEAVEAGKRQGAAILRM